MLDIRAIREDAPKIKKRLETRHDESWKLIDEVLSCDTIRRSSETEKQRLQAERNKTSKEIGNLIGQGKKEEAEAAKAQVKTISEQIKEHDEKSSAAEERQKQLLLSIPNLPHEKCPIGKSEEENPVLRHWGEKIQIEAPLDHLELGECLGILDLETATKLSGAGFALYRGKGAKLLRALIQFLLDLHTEQHGYQECSVPYLVLAECLIGTGQLPKFEEELYGTEPDEEGQSTLYNIPTAEVPLTNVYRESILNEKQLPVKITSHTPCFRREAGAAGRVNKGLIRTHQFDKVELVQITKPDQSVQALEELTSHAEKALQLLGLHYRVIELCTGDLGFGSAKTYDIELWAPGQNDYLEVSSCSNFGDYQARRMKLRFKDSEGTNQFCHTLNGSGTALPRLYVALLEQCQQSDGSIKIPEALVPYFGSPTLEPEA